jgi:hypothetical protein
MSTHNRRGHTRKVKVKGAVKCIKSNPEKSGFFVAFHQLIAAQTQLGFSVAGSTHLPQNIFLIPDIFFFRNPLTKD